VPKAKAAIMAATQRPFALTAITQPSGALEAAKAIS
jgi:hypothetical protein